ncbi:MAG: AraC family transcriptional regulator, partial [Pseudomonadota bacterium]
MIDYVCSHLHEELSLDRLSAVAGFSKFHFHRQFSAYAGLTVAQFVKLTRLKRAAYQLAFDPARSVIDVALDAGFSSPEAFSRAFKESQGQTPSDFRRSPEGLRWAKDQRLPTSTRSNSMNPELVQLEEIRVAVLEHRGPPETLMSSVARFIEWRRSSQDSPAATSRTLGIVYDDPSTTKPDDFRFDICGELRRSLQANGAGIVEKVIPGGRCAVARHVGSTDAIGETVHTMYARWLPQSGEQLRDFPCFFHYIKRMPEVQEHEQVTDVYLPL